MASSVSFRAPGEGSCLRLGPGEYLTDKATGEETDGGYTLYEVVSAAGSGVPLHEHPWAESFYVLEGEYELRYVDENDEEQTVAGKPGAWVHVPAGHLHAFRNANSGFSKMLSINQPVGLEPILRKAGLPCPGPGEEVEKEPLPMEEFSAIFREGGIRIDQERLAASEGVGAWKKSSED